MNIFLCLFYMYSTIINLSGTYEIDIFSLSRTWVSETPILFLNIVHVTGSLQGGVVREPV